MANARYDSKALKLFLDELAGNDRLTVIAGRQAVDSNWQPDCVLQWLANCLRQATAQTRPDIGLFPGLAVTANSPGHDKHRRYVTFMEGCIKRFVDSNMAPPLDLLASASCAVQWTTNGHQEWLRTGHEIRGVLWAMPAGRGFRIGWELPSAERGSIAHITMLSGHCNGHGAALVLWNLDPIVIHAIDVVPDKRLISMLDRSIGVRPVRKQWNNVRASVDPLEIRSAFWEAVDRGLHPDIRGSLMVKTILNTRNRGLWHGKPSFSLTLETDVQYQAERDVLFSLDAVPAPSDPSKERLADVLADVEMLPPAQRRAVLAAIEAHECECERRELFPDQSSYKASDRSLQIARAKLK
jgi:hypothetical protein